MTISFQCALLKQGSVNATTADGMSLLTLSNLAFDSLANCRVKNRKCTETIVFSKAARNEIDYF